MPITINGSNGIDILRIKARVDKIGGDREGIEQVLAKMGDMISQEARVMARQQDIIQTSRMIDSIKHRIRSGVNRITLTVGPFGTHYAKFQELGADRTPASRRAMFARLRELGVLGLRPAKPGFSNTVHKQREFLRPAFNRHAPRTIDMIREFFANNV